jgi:O-antigen/teichoic acid export membrane protein
MVALTTVTLGLLAIVLKAGLNHAFFQSYNENGDLEERRTVVGSTLLFLLVSTSLATLVIYAAAAPESAIIFGGDTSRADLVRLLALNCFFEVVMLVPDSILRARFQSARYSLLNISALAVQLAAISYLVVFVSPSAHSVLLGRLIGTAFEALVFFWAARGELSLKFSPSRIKQMLAFGAPLIFGQLSLTLFMTVDRYFLEKYGTRADVGVYSMANTIVSVITILVTVPFSQVWTVMRFSVMNEEGAEEYYSRVLTYVTYASMFGALAVGAVAGDALHLRGLKSYWPAASIIPLLGLSMVLDSASRVLNVGFTIRKRTIWAPLVTSAALVLNLALNFLLIPSYGPMGATLATLISYFIFCAMRYAVSNRFIRIQYEWLRVSQIILVGAALMGAFYCYDHFRATGLLPQSLYISILIKLGLAISFPVVLLAFKFYEERELRRAGELMKKAVLMIRPDSMAKAAELNR